MARYRMDDGTIIDTALAQMSWEEQTNWDGRNHISRATGSPWNHQELYRSAKGRYYIEHRSGFQGSLPHAEWVSRKQAAAWLIHNGWELPRDLEELAEEVME